VRRRGMPRMVGRMVMMGLRRVVRGSRRMAIGV
jgi:hypothetical protein